MPITACVAVEAVATAKAMGNGKFRSLLHISKKAQPISMNLKTAPEDHHLTLMSKFGENHRGNFFLLFSESIARVNDVHATEDSQSLTARNFVKVWKRGP